MDAGLHVKIITISRPFADPVHNIVFRWFRLEDQRLCALREIHRNVNRSEQGIQLHDKERLRRTFHSTVLRHDKHRLLISDHPKFPAETRALLRVVYLLQKEQKREPAEDLSCDTNPWYPQLQWEMTSTVGDDDRPNFILSVSAKMSPARLDTVERNPALPNLPTWCQEQADVLRLVGTELHEYRLTRRGLKDMHLAQNTDLLPLKQLRKNEP